MTPAQAPSIPTAGVAVRAAADRFRAAGVDSPRLDAWLLLAHILGTDANRLRLRPETPLDRATADAFENLILRRIEDRVPVSRLIGEREFWSLSFRLSEDTLDPRPDSETLVEAALARVPDRSAPRRLLDLGTGSGCLLLALLSELPNARGVGTDVSFGAAASARANAFRLGLGSRARFLVADWAAPLAGRFDLVVANPPYIPGGEITGLAPDVSRHDPARALDGGPDGLDAYRRIVRTLPDLVAAEGHAILEIGEGQAAPVAALLRKAGFASLDIETDLAGKARCLVAGEST